MDNNIRIAQYTDQRMVSPVEENFITIDGTTYATGKDGVGLYRLVPKEKAYFYNEAVPINGKFRLKKCLTDEKKKEAVIKELQRLKDKEQSLAQLNIKKKQQHWVIGVSGTVALSMKIFLSFSATINRKLMLMYGKVSQENYVELTAASAIPNKEIKSPQILRY